MRAELERSERELREQERRVTQFKEEYRGELPSELATNNSRLERLAVQRQTLASQIEAAEARLDNLKSLGDLSNPSSVYSRLSALRSQLVSELAINTEEHPNVIALRRQIEALQRDIDSDAVPVDPAEGAAVRLAREEVEKLRRDLARVSRETELLEEQVALTPKREEEFSALSQRLSVLQETYTANLRKLEAAQLAQSVESAQQGSRVEILELAVPPQEPERSRLKFAIAGIVASIVAASALAILLELGDPVIIVGTQLEELGLPLLGSIGRIE
jgi:uncharacterized protein involved in exopolysaccharide biosynthesis